MKKLVIFLILIGSIVIYIMPLSSETITIEEIKGTVRIKMSDEDQWVVPKSGQAVDKGATVSTGFHSTAVIKMENSLTEVKPLTQIKVEELLATGKQIKSSMYLNFGKIKTKVTKLQNLKTDFKVRSAICTASVRGTEFEFGGNLLIVENGIVLLKSSDGFETMIQGKEKALVQKLAGIIENLAYQQQNSNPQSSNTAEKNDSTDLAKIPTGFIDITVKFED